MQPVMQIRLMVFMGRTMDAKKTQIKQENGDGADTPSPRTETLEQSGNGRRLSPSATLKPTEALQIFSLTR